MIFSNRKLIPLSGQSSVYGRVITQSRNVFITPRTFPVLSCPQKQQITLKYMLH